MNINEFYSELVFKDLKYRLGYNEYIRTPDGIETVIGLSIYDGVQVDYNGKFYKLLDIKPILRRKMTPSEESEYKELTKDLPDKFPCLDYLDKHMIDYRGLIDRNLAEEDTENIYKFK